MIYTFFEQLQMAIKFVLLGIFLCIMLDFIAIYNFKKKVFNIIIQILFWLAMTYLICHAVLKISKGYLPLYTFLFFLLGYFLYVKFLKRDFINTLLKTKSIIKKNKQKILMFFYSHEVITAIKKIFKMFSQKGKQIYKLISKKKNIQKEAKNGIIE